MPRLSIRRTRQFALLSGIVCALVFAPAAWLLYRIARSETEGVWLFLLLALTVVASSGIITGLITLFFAFALRDLILRLRQTVFHSTEPVSSAPESRSLFEESERLGHQIAADQRLLRRRNAELQMLATVSRALNRASQLDEMLDTVLEQMSSLHLYRKGYIALADEQSGELSILASRGYSPDEIQALGARIGEDEAAEGCTCLPLRATSGTIGTIYLETESLDQDTCRSLSLLGDVLATTVEKYRLLESAQREVRAQKVLNEAGRVLNSTLDEQEVLTLIMREVIQALDVEAGSVVLLDREKGDMYFAAAAGPESEDLIGERMPMGHGIVGWAIDRGESVLVADAGTDPRHYRPIDQLTGLSTESVICVPLLSKERAIGAIEVLNPRRGHFGPHDLQLLEALSPQAAIAIENATLFESIKEQMAELERAQDQLLQAEKLSAIGRLVAGVAHELNNPLTAIVGYSQLLLETCSDPEICEDLERINGEAQRSAHIVQNLLAFARQQKMERRALELGDILEKTIDLLAYQLQVDNITLVPEIAPHKTTVLGDSYQLQQVFLNLITNAHQAMRKAHGRGTLIIRSELAGPDTVRVSVIDDGPGVPREIAHRIFDPFFTTKDVGEGTGLGLSICLGILQEHNGRIRLDERAQPGATFVVELPLYHDTDKSEQASDDKDQVTRSQELSVLVVDDEHEITVLLQRILEGEGHRVVAVNSGVEAREALGERQFDLLICDLKMPGMDGRELYAYVQQEHPHLAKHVIFSTGDTVSDESWNFLNQVDNRYISKPFKPSQVLAEIGELLAEQHLLSPSTRVE